jgi:hypothetical protein
MIKFSSSLCVFLMMQHSIFMVSWTDIAAEFGVVSNIKKLSNIRGTQQRLKCGMSWRRIASLDLLSFRRNHDGKPVMPGHISCDAQFWQDNSPTFWKRQQSHFKQTLSEQVDWKRWFSSTEPKITRPETTGLFPLRLCEEYHPPRENCRSSNPAML